MGADPALKQLILDLLEEERKRSTYERLFLWQHTDARRLRLAGPALVFHSSAHINHLVDALSSLLEYKSILYISLNKSFSHVKEAFRGSQRAFSKLLVVDCASSLIFEDASDSPQCITMERPETLHEVMTMASTAQHAGTADIVIIDALSDYARFDGSDFTAEKAASSTLESVQRQTGPPILFLFDTTRGKKANVPLYPFSDVLFHEVVKEDSAVR